MNISELLQEFTSHVKIGKYYLCREKNGMWITYPAADPDNVEVYSADSEEKVIADILANGDMYDAE